MNPKIIHKDCFTINVDKPVANREFGRNYFGEHGQVIIDCNFDILHFTETNDSYILDHLILVETLQEAEIVKQITKKKFKECILLTLDLDLEFTNVMVFESKEAARKSQFFLSENQLTEIYVFE